MKGIRFWIPTAIGILITPLCLFAAAASTGAGHGGYGAMLVLYPLSSLMLVIFAGAAPADAFAAQIVHALSIALVVGCAILQFPFYGFILSYSRLRESCWLTVCWGVVCLHIIVVALWLVITVIMNVILRL